MRSNSQSNIPASSPVVEGLEDRLLMAASAARIIAQYYDNRGMASFDVSSGLDTSTLSRKTCSIFLAGADGKFNTADDARLYTAVGYRKGKLSLRADVPINTPFRVRIDATRVKDANGYFLDGEFSSATDWSGNRRAGGSFDVVTQTSNDKRVRFWTASGTVDVRLYSNVATTVTNFLSYVNQADATKNMDNFFFHRSVVKASQGFGVIQGGGFKLESGLPVQLWTGNGIAVEGTNPNAKGTIAMANTGAANSTTRQFYFNVVDNSAAFGNNYSVFGQVMDTPSQRVIDAINAYPIQDYSSIDSAMGEVPTMPVTNSVVMVTRTAQMMDPVATPAAAQPAVAAATTSAPVVSPALAVTTNVSAGVFATGTPIRNSLLDEEVPA